MAEKLTIRYWDDPVLSTVCDAVEDNEFGPKLEEFGESLLATMDDRRGIGLAAPQVGVAKRMFVMTFPDGYKSDDDPKPIVVINPILDLSGRTLREVEGCLSMPGVHLQIERAANVVMRYRNIHGTESVLELSDMNARVVQHETDHLNGVFFVSRVSRQMRRQALREWEREKEQRGLAK
jgi:peptide deformylase